jgi:cellulose synthase/poly-beta-1,6-N-acetylglucosamine synthase-like glycosyltransferase
VAKRYQEPRVSIVIAMHNERSIAESKIRNCLDLDYPADKLQVCVALDGPTDGTEEVVRPFEAEGVSVIYSRAHVGKAMALNSALQASTGEIVVFTDARQKLEPAALRELTANFADDSVGAVSGELFLLDSEGGEAGDTVGFYWRYEKRIRALESEIHSVVGATGAIYAIRRSLFEPLPAGTILDDVLIPMRIVLAGKRVIFEPMARAFDEVSASPEAEYARKSRTLTGNYQLLAEAPALFDPRRNPIFLQLLSHKVGRLVVPYLLMTVLVLNLFLAGPFYRLVLAAQLCWYSLAAAGAVVSSRRCAGPAAGELDSSPTAEGA